MNYSGKYLKDAEGSTYPGRKISGSVKWKSPSNIAIVKYWGKKAGQIPANPSISFTLKNSYSTVEIEYEYSPDISGPEFEVYFEGKLNENFRPKIKNFFASIIEYLPFAANLRMKISSENTFPHSAGIASSASSMSAIALCLLDIESELSGKPQINFQKASFLSRLGSGSAARSVYGGFVSWGKRDDYEDTNDTVATKIEYHEAFAGIKDAVLIVDSGKKNISSSKGHGLMEGHMFADERFRQASVNYSLLRNALENGGIDEFLRIAEAEALALHSMMALSTPPYVLMKPGTISIINRLEKLRKSSGADFTYTLDAGPNVHLLYFPQCEREIRNMIDNSLREFCEGGKVIFDEIGKGPEKI